MNGGLLRRRRLELGLSRRSVAREAGVSEGALARIEHGGAADEWPLRSVRALASALALPPSQMLAARVDSLGADEEDDAAIIGALLARTGRLTPTSALAHATGWELARVNRAIRSLDLAPRSTGQHIQRLRGHVALRPSGDQGDAVVALARREVARRGLNRSQVAMLTALADGSFDEQRLSEAERVTLASLMNSELVEDTREGVALTEAARFSLLDDFAGATG